jgi:hypothetical protein
LLEAAQKELAETTQNNGVDPEMRLVRNAKKIALFTLGVAHQKHGADLEKHQEVVMSLSDLFMETFAMESTFLRCRNLVANGNSVAQEICQVFLRDAITRMQAASQNVLSACSGSELDRHMSKLRSLAEYQPVNAIQLRRNVAERLLSSERYIF